MQKHVYIDQNKDRLVIITDEAEAAWEYHNSRQPYLFLLTPQNQGASLPLGAYCVERLEDATAEYLDQVYRRVKGLPWDILETDRLRLREIMEADVERLYELYADEEIIRYMEPLFPTIEQEREYTRDYIRNIYSFYGYGMWVIVHKETDEIIGRAGVEYKEGFDGLEIGFMLGKGYQHQGYAYEACKAVLDYVWEELENSCVYAVVHEENILSVRLCERLGFQQLRSKVEELVPEHHVIMVKYR